MGDVVDRLLALWTDTPDGDDDALAAFQAFYADPVVVNGVPLSAAQMVARARTVRAGIADLAIEVIDEFEAPGRVVVVHRITGRAAGPSGAPVEQLTIDVLVVADGLVTQLWVASGPPPSPP